MIAMPERKWDAGGRLEQNDGILAIQKPFYIDGLAVAGFVMDAGVWQESSGYVKEVDKNLGTSMSGANL